MNCQGLFGRLFGHKYEPRYSRVLPSTAERVELGSFKGTGKQYAAVVDAWKDSVYHGEACVRCGHVLKVQA